MKLKDYIKKLQKIVKDKSDLILIHSLTSSDII